MKKKILIVHSDLSIGGAETSLLGLLNTFDYNKYEIDLFLYNHTGELYSLIPEKVHILEGNSSYKSLCIPLVEVLKRKKFGVFFARFFSKVITKLWGTYNKNLDLCYMQKQLSHKFASVFLKKYKKEYDLGISFNDPHYIIYKNFNAKKMIFWFHTDFDKVGVIKRTDIKMWEKGDYIATVSEKCKDSFVKKYPSLKAKCLVIENILNEKMIRRKALESVTFSMNKETINLLSIGRFCEAKNFDNIPEICSLILKAGLNIKWYVIGYGSDEKLITDKIKEFSMEENVLILGKKENPYSYISQCDFYIQPSRYEGKCVTVREAQMLDKVVIITNYATAVSQIKNGVDGVIVPMGNTECAKGIIEVIQNNELQNRIRDHIKNCNFSNKEEIKKIYSIL